MKIKRVCSGIAAVILVGLASSAAHAADGCKFLLCIAGPWQSISECRPTVKEVLRDLARGHPIPTCNMGSSGSSNTGASYRYNSASTCPRMYWRLNPRTGDYYHCSYPYVITVNIDGALWEKVYFQTDGDTSTWYSDAARSALKGDIDPTYDRDLSAWEASQQPSPGDGDGGGL